MTTATAATRSTAGSLPSVVLVEDNPDDALLIREAYARTRIANPLAVACDGMQALALALDPATDERPGLMLLDLVLPRLSGFAVIARLRGSKRTMTMPIVVLSSSSERDDIEASYAAGANSYLVKPLEFASLEKLLRCATQYWLRHNEQPPPA
jgi:two-component system, response regulator